VGGGNRDNGWLCAFEIFIFLYEDAKVYLFFNK
jgi:hypothetical protein